MSIDIEIPTKQILILHENTHALINKFAGLSTMVDFTNLLLDNVVINHAYNLNKSSFDGILFDDIPLDQLKDELFTEIKNASTYDQLLDTVNDFFHKLDNIKCITIRGTKFDLSKIIKQKCANSYYFYKTVKSKTNLILNKYDISSYTSRNITKHFKLQKLPMHIYEDLVCVSCRDVPNRMLWVKCNPSDEIIHPICAECFSFIYNNSKQYTCSYCTLPFSLDDMVVIESEQFN